MNKIGDMPSINNLSNDFFQRPTFSDVNNSTVHHLGNVRNYNSSVKRRSLFFHDFFSVQADKPRDGINLICYLSISGDLKTTKHMSQGTRNALKQKKSESFHSRKSEIMTKVLCSSELP